MAQNTELSQYQYKELQETLSEIEDSMLRTEIRKRLEEYWSDLSEHEAVEELSNTLNALVYLDREGLFDEDSVSSAVLKDATTVYFANAIKRSLSGSLKPFTAFKKSRRFQSYSRVW